MSSSPEINKIGVNAKVLFTCPGVCGDTSALAETITVLALDVDPPLFVIDAVCRTCDEVKSFGVNTEVAQSLLDVGAKKVDAPTSAEGARAGAFSRPDASPFEQAWFAQMLKRATPEQIASGKIPFIALTPY